MSERRVQFGFGVHYRTPVELVERIGAMVRAIVEKQQATRFDRAHFKDFGESSLDFEVVYWMRDPDYNRYMDTQQSINVAMMRTFEDAGIEFAYPTRTLMVDGPVPIKALKSRQETQSNIGKIK
jgi:small-conductance mechanosensitive channel